MPYLLANDFAGLQSAENAADSNRRQALSSAMNAALQGGQMMGAKNRADAQMEFAQKQHEDQMAMEAQKLELEMGRNTVAEEHYRSQNALGEKYAKIQQDALDLQKNQGTPAGNREHDLMWSQAVNDADRGLIEDPNDAAKQYPTLSASEHQVLGRHSSEARRGIQATYDVAAHAADTLNKHSELSRIIPLNKKAIDAVHIWSGSDAKARRDQAQQQLDDAQSAKQTLDPVVANIRNDKRLGSMITFDPESNAYVPAVPAPSWTKPPPPASPEAPAGWTPTSGGGWLKPSAAPTGALPSSGAPAAASAPASPPAAPAAGAAAAPKRKYNDWIYNRVNEIVSQMPGKSPSEALKQAINEDAALFSR